MNLAIAARSYLELVKRGNTHVSYTMVLDDNWPSRRTAEKLGGRVCRELPGLSESSHWTEPLTTNRCQTVNAYGKSHSTSGFNRQSFCENPSIAH